MKPRIDFVPGDALGQRYETWFDLVDTARYSVEDLLRPQYWVACLRLKSNDLIRCVAKDGSYDFMLKVTSHKVANNRNAITVSLWPELTPELIAAVDGTATSEMVPTVVNGKPVPRIEVMPSGQWRLIGFDGQAVGDPHYSEEAADEAKSAYLDAHGISSEIEQPAVDARTGEVVAPKPTQVTPADRPGQFSHAKKKEIAKREAKMAKRRELDERNKARTAERLAVEAASDAA